MEAVHYNRKLGPNYMVKISVIDGGMQAIEHCVNENIPICTTEVFTIAQIIDMCDLYEKAARRSGNYPPFFITHITSIFDECLHKYAKREKVDIDEKILAQAGCPIARREYRLIKERGYRTIMLGGGVRKLYHFTDMVGGEIHVSINSKDVEALLERDAEMESRIDVQTSEEVIDEHCAKFEVFRKAYLPDGLKRKAYAGFGPVQLFRNAFMMGWLTLLAEVSKRRNALAF
jgi:transaldolase